VESPSVATRGHDGDGDPKNN